MVKGHIVHLEYPSLHKVYVSSFEKSNVKIKIISQPFLLGKISLYQGSNQAPWPLFKDSRTFLNLNMLLSRFICFWAKVKK